jgi:rubrerythrin
MDIEDALAIAIDYECKVRDHYAKGASMIEDPEGKRVFETLAREEQAHADYLSSCRKTWAETGRIRPGDPATVLPQADWIDVARERIARGPSKKIASKSELELLRIALDLERRTSAFYCDLAETIHPAHRPLFVRFLAIEAGHVRLVQAEIDSLTKSGSWFDFVQNPVEPR